MDSTSTNDTVSADAIDRGGTDRSATSRDTTSSFDRLIPLDGATNFRDVGGYVTASGESVRLGRVYRSDGLHDLTPTDIERLLLLRLGEVFDLRSLQEVEAFGATPLTDHGVRRHHVPFFVSLDAVARPSTPAGAATDPPRVGSNVIPGTIEPEAFAARYLEWLEPGKAAVRTIFAATAAAVEADSHALVFHCTAGRDRTGLVAALLLSSLGVDDETVALDYHLTERYLRFPESRLERMRHLFGPSNASPSGPPPTPAAVMRHALTGIRQRYGAVDSYLAEAGVTADVRRTLRAYLLS